jgi:anti-sigma factor RsiW
MSCKIIQTRLQELLEGKLPAVERREVEAHLGDCAECASLITLLRLDVPADRTPDLTASVLSRTSGSACGRAEEILCERIDGTLEGLDSELLTGHLDDCEGCTGLATALRRLGEELPAMAEIQPGPGFVEAVLAATLPQPSRWSALAARWARGWADLVARPRIAWEAGYLGSMALWLVFSVFGAPFEASSVPLPAADAPVKIVDGLTSRVTTFGQRTWEVTGGRGLATWNGLHDDLYERFQRSEASRIDLRRNGANLKDALLDFDLKESGRAWSGLTGDARTVLKQFAGDAPAADTATE